MRPMIITRIHRRCIVKYFGSCKNLLIWVFSVLVTVFVLDSYFFSGFIQRDKTKILENNNKPIHEEEGGSPRNLSCGQPSPCPVGQYSYVLKSGVSKDGQPTICFNGNVIFSPTQNNGKRGFCLVRMNAQTLAVEDVRTFDTYEDDTVMQRYINLGVAKNDILFLATVDEASLHLSEATKQLVASFSSSFIKNLEFRDSFVMIGQRHLAPPSKAIEQLMKRKDGEIYANEATIQGCTSLPLGTLLDTSSQNVPEGAPQVGGTEIEDKVMFGDYSINCGVPIKCPQGSLPIRVFTGNKNSELPKVCFRSKYILSPKLNNPGRGIMVICIDLISGAVMSVQRFDTYESADQSNKMVEFLKTVQSNQIIVALAHDEAKTALSDAAKSSLTSFGSSFISDLNFRDVWFFVGKPNLRGFSPYEDIEPAGKDTWPFPIDAKFCLDLKFKGQPNKIDLNLKKNVPRRTFCKTYDGYEEFCSVNSIDLHPKPLPLVNKSLEGTAIYKVPIVLIPGLSQVSTLKQLEALFNIPGFDLNYLVMMNDEKFEESHSLASLFNVTTHQLASSTKYITLVHGAMELVWKLFPAAKYAIILEEEVLPTIDWLSYFGQCLDTLESDGTLVGVTAFNENGFTGLSNRPDLVYRGNTFPGLGFMLRKSFYLKHMATNIMSCCSARSWFGWNLPEGMEMLIPDLSRVVRRVYLGLTEHAEFIREYFNKPRIHSKNGPYKLSNMSSLTMKSYKKMIEKLITTALPIPLNDLEACIEKPGITLSSGTHVVFFVELSTQPNLFANLCKCFNLLHAPKFKVRGTHNSTLRFTYQNAEVILVSSKSPYYSLKPTSYKPIGG